MQYTSHYDSPLGQILLAADDMGLTGLWFEKQKYFGAHLDPACTEKELDIFDKTKRWLDIYFSGRVPESSVPLHFIGTDFQKEVWEILSAVPYGETRTYGELAGILARRRGLEKMSARAVGAAVGQNRISVIVPCHRVLGANGSLTGYAGGLERKMALLKLEKIL